MWDDLIKYSNKGQYGKFVLKFSYNLLFGLNEVEMGKQFEKSGLTRSLDPNWDFLGTIRRGEHVTMLYRVRSSKKPGEWLGRMVLGYEDGEVKIFGASVSSPGFACHVRQNPDVIEDNKYVELTYEVVDKNSRSVLTAVHPLGYVQGVNEVLAPTVVAELVGKKAGEVIEVPIDCNQLYGPRDESLVVIEPIHNGRRISRTWHVDPDGKRPWPDEDFYRHAG